MAERERERESSIWETERHDLSLAIGLRQKTLRICVGKAKGKQPQTSQTERQICSSEGFRLWAIIVLSCAYVFLYSNTPLSDTICLMDNDAHLLMSSIYVCLITMNSTLQTCIFPAALRCLLSFCFELFWCCKNHRDGFCMTDGIKENLEATFNNCKSLIEKTARVCVSREDEKEKSTELLFRRVSSAVSRGLRVERRSKLSVNKNDSNTDFSQHLHTRNFQACEQKKGMVGGERESERRSLHAG